MTLNCLAFRSSPWRQRHACFRDGGDGLCWRQRWVEADGLVGVGEIDCVAGLDRAWTAGVEKVDVMEGLSDVGVLEGFAERDISGVAVVSVAGGVLFVWLGDDPN